MDRYVGTRTKHTRAYTRIKHTSSYRETTQNDIGDMSSPQLSYDVSTLTVEEYFGYSPSLALAATAIGLYFAAALVIVVQLLIAKNKNALYMYIVVFTGLTEAGGYVALTWMIKNTGSANLYGAYVTMQVLVVLSPNLLQAVTYKTVGKISGMCMYMGGLHLALSSHVYWLLGARTSGTLFL